MTCGVYAIQNVDTKKVYIGSSIEFEHRINEHFNDLRQNKHCNSYLQASFNLHGRDVFVVEFLERCSNEEELLDKEQIWLDYFNSKYGVYNIAQDIRRPTLSAETRKKISNTLSGRPTRPMSEETKRKLRESCLGRKMSEEAKEKLRIYRTGKVASEETKQKLSKILRGKKRPEEAIRKTAEAHRGMKRPAESVKRSADGHRGKIFTEEHRRKISESKKGKKLSEYHKQRIRDSWVIRRQREAKALEESSKE